ncbi:MAG TPA: phytanoyl-CoA dioxygenase family protein [Dinghuibacter sp.]|uniref:phytanoyl-CoA dioxygenase family protein n=1 Tax=Dinghuibacter sp. TaxID=2024697 RepID=UPI002CB07053|nr:phytanoyl-CoA dioxygenase family protein [Dinghuibacter sp.]HTJ13951.1 phytanoyl-CoA dioxygenase family protein [Dinghuibacter sp.]
MNSPLTAKQITDYQRDGYVIVPALFSREEIDKLFEVARSDAAISDNSYDVRDESGKRSKLALWFTPGDDIYGLLTRSERMVGAVDALLGGSAPVCHFHSKLMQKEPFVGGAWEWHQDYGYWYKNEFLFPDQMASVMVAITEATRENGCLQVIRGSHKMGRVEHGKTGEQVGASIRYVSLALDVMDLVYVELKPGDALFFHSNLLHRSDANVSPVSRWSLISCYNRQSNKPFNEASSSCITPLEVVPDGSLLAASAAGMAKGADFLTKEGDVTLREE